MPASSVGRVVTPGASADDVLRFCCAALAALILAAQVPNLITVWALPDWNGYGAIDYRLYMAATGEWLATGTFYPPEQLAAPYAVTFGAILYPPIALWLFVPFTLLPAALWWAIPLGVTAWVIWSHGPARIAWPIMALCLWEPVQIHIISGNPGLWSMMFVALATRWPAFGPFAFVKASLGVFGLRGIRHRAWWVGLAVFCAMSLAVLPVWLDWVRVLVNSQGTGGLFYSWQEAPMMLLPIIAWLARPGGRYDVPARRRVEADAAVRLSSPTSGWSNRWPPGNWRVLSSRIGPRPTGTGRGGTKVKDRSWHEREAWRFDRR